MPIAVLRDKGPTGWTVSASLSSPSRQNEERTAEHQRMLRWIKQNCETQEDQRHFRSQA